MPSNVPGPELPLPVSNAVSSVDVGWSRAQRAREQRRRLPGAAYCPYPTRAGSERTPSGAEPPRLGPAETPEPVLTNAGLPKLRLLINPHPRPPKFPLSFNSGFIKPSSEGAAAAAPGEKEPPGTPALRTPRPTPMALTVFLPTPGNRHTPNRLNFRWGLKKPPGFISSPRGQHHL